MAVSRYFVHNGFVGMAVGMPGDPQLISESDAAELMRRAALSQEQVVTEYPPAQFAETGDPLFRLFGGARFLSFGDIERCANTKRRKITKPLQVDWSAI